MANRPAHLPRRRLKNLFLTLLIAYGVVAATVAAASTEVRKSPVDGGVITSGIGWRLDPFGSGKMLWHNGYDISVPVGTPVHPVEGGTVYFAGNYRGYGEMVVVDHHNGYVTIYGHNSELKVKSGDVVTTDSVLALSGSTGRSTGPHVHYELRKIPGYEKAERSRLEESLKQAVQDKVDGWVEDFVKGKGGDSDGVLPEGDGL